VALLRHKNVGGLDIAMNDALGVRGIQCIGNLDSKRQQVLDIQRLSSDLVLQRLPFHEFHGNKCPIAHFIDLIDGADIRMIEGRGGFGFALKSAESLSVARDIVGQEFKRDKTTEFQVLGLIHDAHPAPAQLLDNSVMGDCFANHWRESYVVETGQSMSEIRRRALLVLASNFAVTPGGAIMLPSMQSPIRMARLVFFAALSLAFCLIPPVTAPAQTQARRLILKDGSYQSVTKYEVRGDRVRYFSAERGEWEEVPNSLIDWDATEKFEQGREQGKLAPEAVELDKELEAERKAEQAHSPQIAPGLRLPDEGGIFLLDTFENQPQLSELQQSGSDLESNKKSNILRTAINPLAGAKQTIELREAHAKIQSHTLVPSLYVNIDSNAGALASVPASASDAQSLPPTERFKIIRVEVKGGKRIAGAVKIAVTGKMKSNGRFIEATVTTMTGGWIKLTPTEPLTTGEYAVAEMLGKEEMNLYVWDFGVNPAAPTDPFARKPDLTEARPKTDQPADLQKRDKQ
jgi:hypothetical protein